MKKYLLVSIFTISIHFLFAQANTFIQEIIPAATQNNSVFREVLAYPNGNFLMAIEIQINPYSTLLVMFDSHGDTLWTKQIDSLSINNIQNYANIDKTKDGGCILLGDKYIFGSGSFVLTKIDSSGHESWSSRYVYSYDVDSLIDVVQTRDFGFAFMGQTTEPFGLSGASLLKVNSIGDTLWTRRYVYLFAEINDFEEATDGGFYIIGRNFTGLGLLVRTDSAGSIMWVNTYSPVGQYGFRSAKIADVSNDTILIVENSYWNMRGNIIEISDSGTVINALQLDSSFFPTNASILSGGRILMTGFHGQKGGSLNLLDSQMNILWSRVFEVPSWQPINDFGIQAVLKSDNNFWVVGNFFDGATIYSSYIISADSLGFSSCYTINDTVSTTPININMNTINNWQEALVPFQIVSESHSYSGGASINVLCNVGLISHLDENFFQLSPNPASSSFTIYAFPELQNGEVEIFNLLGKKVVSNQWVSGKEEIAIDVRDLSPGLYFVKVQTEKGSEVKKLIIEN